MRTLIGSLMALALAVPVHAATLTVVTTADLGQGGPTENFTYEVAAAAFTPAFSVQMQAGDVFDFTINFQAGQTLTITNPSLFWAFSFADQVTDVQGTGHLELLDGSGAVLFTSVTKTDTEGAVHFGQFFGPSDFTALPTTLTIGGLHYVGTLDAYVDPAVTVRTYAEPRLSISADTVVATVPEPSNALLLLAGLGVGVALWRRRVH